jgi:peptide/nickel transport system permease protein
MAEVAALEHVEPASPGGPEVAGRSPWALAGRRLLRNRFAIGGLVLLLLIIAISFAAPLYADHVAHTNPFENNLNGTTIVNGKKVPLMQQGRRGTSTTTSWGPTRTAATSPRASSTAGAARSRWGSARP